MRPYIPQNELGFRKAIYAGEIFHLEGNESTKSLVREIQKRLVESFGQNYRKAHEDELDFFSKVSALRKESFLNYTLHDLQKNILIELGLNPALYLYEGLKLRAVAHDGHLNPAAAPVYFGHRDTWYATPQSTINFWIAINDLDEDESFVFYPEVFEKAIPNDSSKFRYWTNKLGVGWEKEDEGRKNFFPTMDEKGRPGNALGFSAKEASLLIFSGSHYHQTRKQALHKTRFSLDFRIVHKDDEASGVGAPNVDNASKGSCLSSYQSFL